MDKLLIGIGFKKGRGKDTIADRLVDQHNFIRVSWADSLKAACQEIFGFSYEQLFGDLKEVVDPYWGKSPREVLQQVGTDALRDNFDKDIWIKSAWLKIQKAMASPRVSGVVVPDVRFPNEANFIKSKGGVLWRVDRNIEDNNTSLHSSETSLEDYKEWDYILENNSTIEDLHEMIDLRLSVERIRKGI